MNAYKLGSVGDEVRKIQERLGKLGFYRGPVDGIFGAGTRLATEQFQAQRKLEVDGIVGPLTWKALFNGSIVSPALHQQPMDYKALALTGTFETDALPPECFAGLSGDFDGQGISMGVLQWNFGQGSLDPLLKEMIKNHPALVRSIFDSYWPVLDKILKATFEERMDFAHSINHPVRKTVLEPWRTMFKTLGRTPEFQQIQVAAARRLFSEALALCAKFKLASQRAACLMFDIKVQNGGIRPIVAENIKAGIGQLPAGVPADQHEIRKMEVVATCIANACNPRWREDVLSRKLCCAHGAGIVHGGHILLEEQFGITLAPFEGPQD